VGLKSFGRLGAIGGHAAVEALVRTAMLVRTRRELGTTLSGILPWAQLAHLAVASLLAALPVVAIQRLPAAQHRPFAWLMVAGAAYALVYAGALALGPGEGSPLAKLKRALL